MIGYVNLGTNDLARAAVFYDAIAAELGVGRIAEWEHCIGWGPAAGAGLYVTRPFNREPASAGNGVMLALTAKDKGQVDRLHELALALGGADEGAPGYRGEGFYAAYFRDLDGNKLAAFFVG